MTPEQGALSAADRATAEKLRILSSHYPNHIPDEIDLALRAKHKICPTREAMGRAG